jgi:hypothetical protein
MNIEIEFCVHPIILHLTGKLYVGGHSMSFEKKLLNCIDCKKNFYFTVEEQEFRSSRGFPNDPGRCRPCRVARKPQSDNRAGTKSFSDNYLR